MFVEISGEQDIAKPIKYEIFINRFLDNELFIAKNIQICGNRTESPPLTNRTRKLLILLLQLLLTLFLIHRSVVAYITMRSTLTHYYAWNSGACSMMYHIRVFLCAFLVNCMTREFHNLCNIE